MTITINNKTLELVEVPEDAKNFHVVCGRLVYKDSSSPYGFTTIPLHHSSYRILCKASEATEEQAREIVESMIYLGYRDYLYKKEIDSEDFELCFKYNFYTATESLHSFCRSIGATPETTLIIKIEKL